MKKAVTKTTEKYVTEKAFEKVMESVAKTLQKMDEKNEKNFDRVFDEFKSIREENRDFKSRMMMAEIATLKHDNKIEKILVRVEKLESKVK